MSEQDITLKSINDLRLDGSDNVQRYYIAAYQRGYRWTPLQVTQLLGDIREFTLRRNPQPEHFYCLQPIVVKIAKEGGFEVVDGQQRLTTILLILRYFNERLVEKHKIPLFSLAYQTRPGLDNFLQHPDQQQAKVNIDFSHLYAALQTVESWFNEHENEVEAIKAAFLNQTKVIWFQLAESDNPVDAFTRLNVGKIPLTNGELIRALFLRRLDDRSSSEDLQMRIAHEWDLIEKSMQNDPFWYFLSNEAGPTQNRIGFLFDLVAAVDGLTKQSASDAYSVFYHFSGKLNEVDADLEAEWLRIKQTFMMLEEWFEDRRLFHIVGFLVHTGESINKLLEMTKDSTKDEFEKRLRDLVFELIIGDMPLEGTRAQFDQQVREILSTLHYDRHKPGIRSLLLLFNVATLLENTASNIRFQFDSFKKGAWDIEHVRSISPDYLNTPARRKEWLLEVRAYLDSQASTEDSEKDESPDRNEEYRTNIDEFLAYDDPKSRVDEFNLLYEKLVGHFGEKTELEPDHSIANLVLLDAKTNRSYSNAVFALKRQRLLNLDRAGIFVPLCTRNVFLKCYSDDVMNSMFWKKEDGKAYTSAITKTLTNFFLGETETFQ